jgi:hypothetical protein
MKPYGLIIDAKMKSSALDSNFLSDLNAVRLKEEELSKVLAAARKAQETGATNNWTGIMTAIRLFNNSPEKAKAIIFRLQALASMIEKDELGGWILGYGTSMMPAIAQKALVAAAANHPLSIINGDVSFEKESFLRRVFELAEPQGKNSN